MREDKLTPKRILIGSYIIVIALYVYFTISSWSEMDTIGKLINFSMLIIAGWIFNWSRKQFEKVNEVIYDLNLAKIRVNQDKNDQSIPLWGFYHNNGLNKDWKDTLLSSRYQDYVGEMNRLEKTTKGGYKCSIETYVNRDIIDLTINKNMMSLIPGVMTGLGILGTFIGLSLGLENFNTGSATEISESIAPLMNGIKVAFHTSIYGMILSLFFNWAYKKMLRNAYESIEDFLDVFNEYVYPDTENDYHNQILTSLPVTIGEKISELLEPQFEKMAVTLEEFTKHILDNQVAGVGEIVDHFIGEMNSSLGNNFVHLGEVLDKTCEVQEQNNEYMQSVLEKIGGMTSNIVEINRLSESTITSMSTYVDKIENLQQMLSSNYEHLSHQLEQHQIKEEHMQRYIDSLVTYEAKLTETSDTTMDCLQQYVDQINQIQDEFIKSMSDNLTGMRKTEEIFIGQMVESSNAHIKNMEEQLKSSYDNTMTILGDLNKNVLEDISTVASNTVNDISLVSQNNITQISEMSQKQIEQIIAFANEKSTDIKIASEELGRVVEQLNMKLEEGLNSTHDAFDKEFTQIIDHLSGTIEMLGKTLDTINDTTNALPGTITSSCDMLSKYLDRTFETFDNELGMIASHLSGTIQKINSTLSDLDNTTQNVPKAITMGHEKIQEDIEHMHDNFVAYIQMISDIKAELNEMMDAN